MRKTFVAGNWKMNGSRESIAALVDGIKAGMGDVTAEVAVCPPFPYIAEVASAVDGSAIGVGSQNICDEDGGAFTAEVSGAMLTECGCAYAIVGHSERRALYGESDELIAKRYMAAQRNGLKPILCVGETLDEREADETEAVVGRQLDAVIEAAGIDSFANAVIAYEPVWAIGTGKTASPQQAQDVHAFIRQKLAGLNADVAESIQIQYGGSVKPGNAQELFAQPDIDGGLIGGASLAADDFLAICRAGA